MKSLRAPVVANAEVAPGIWSLWFEHAGLARACRPGHFLNLKPGPGPDPLLRRPLSVCDIERNRIRLVFRAPGRGTALLAQLRPGDELDILGPLGRPVRLPKRRTVLLCGGGVGAAPLLLLARRLRDENRVKVFLGARAAEGLILTREFSRLRLEVGFATDDGSHGHRGPVTDLVVKNVHPGTGQLVYACGPLAMLADLSRRVKGAEAWGFFEERMGCGTGICYCCALPRKGGGYTRFCQEGPVVRLDEVEL